MLLVWLLSVFGRYCNQTSTTGFILIAGFAECQAVYREHPESVPILHRPVVHVPARTVVVPAIRVSGPLPRLPTATRRLLRRPLARVVTQRTRSADVSPCRQVYCGVRVWRSVSEVGATVAVVSTAGRSNAAAAFEDVPPLTSSSVFGGQPLKKM